MRNQLNQFIFSPLSWLMMLVIVCLLSLVLFFITPIGPRLASSIASTILPSLQVKGIDGTLLSDLKIKKLSWNKNVNVELVNIHLNADNYNFKTGVINSEVLSVETLDIKLPHRQNSKDLSDIPNFGLPVNINAKRIKLGQLRVFRKERLIFHARDLELLKAKVESKEIIFERLMGNIKTKDAPVNIALNDGFLNMNKPHNLKTKAKASFKHLKSGDYSVDIDVTGKLNKYEFEGNFQAKSNLNVLEKMGEQIAQIKGEGDFRKIHFYEIQLDGDEGFINASAELNWYKTLNWKVVAKSERFATKNLIDGVDVDIKTELTYKGGIEDNKLVSVADIETLKGKWRGFPIDVKGKVLQDKINVKAENLMVNVGDNTLTLDGAISNERNFNWKLKANRLSQLHPELSGKVNGKGSAIGFKDKLTIQSQLKLEQFLSLIHI